MSTLESIALLSDPGPGFAKRLFFTGHLGDSKMIGTENWTFKAKILLKRK